MIKWYTYMGISCLPCPSLLLCRLCRAILVRRPRPQYELVAIAAAEFCRTRPSSPRLPSFRNSAELPSALSLSIYIYIYYAFPKSAYFRKYFHDVHVFFCVLSVFRIFWTFWWGRKALAAVYRSSFFSKLWFTFV